VETYDFVCPFLKVVFNLFIPFHGDNFGGLLELGETRYVLQMGGIVEHIQEEVEPLPLSIVSSVSDSS